MVCDYACTPSTSTTVPVAASSLAVPEGPPLAPRHDTFIERLQGNPVLPVSVCPACTTILVTNQVARLFARPHHRTLLQFHILFVFSQAFPDTPWALLRLWLTPASDSRLVEYYPAFSDQGAAVSIFRVFIPLHSPFFDN